MSELPCSGRWDVMFSASAEGLAEAKAVCSECRFTGVEGLCYQRAIRLPAEPSCGVWGGVKFPEERRQLLAEERRHKRDQAKADRRAV